MIENVIYLPFSHNLVLVQVETRLLHIMHIWYWLIFDYSIFHQGNWGILPRNGFYTETAHNNKWCANGQCASNIELSVLSIRGFLGWNLKLVNFEFLAETKNYLTKLKAEKKTCTDENNCLKDPKLYFPYSPRGSRRCGCVPGWGGAGGIKSS